MNLIKRLLKKYLIGMKNYLRVCPDRTYDFEGRCVICHKPLRLILNVKDIHEINLRVIPCSKHPDESLILWPSGREDIINLFVGEQAK